MVARQTRGRRLHVRLLPQERLSGPMPWIISIMIFLTILAGALGLALQQGAQTITMAAANRLTVQVVEPDPQARVEAVARLVQRLNGMPGVGRVAPVPPDRLMRQLEPWLGSGLDQAGIPVPALIDVDLAAGTRQPALIAEAIARKAQAISPRIEVQPHASYLAPVGTLVRTIGWIAFAIVALMVVATGCVVVLAARGAHATHRGTIDIMHMLGATDSQVMRLFQRRMTVDVAMGALIGLVCALAVIFLIGRSMKLIAGDLLQSAAVPSWGWAVLSCIPLLFLVIAWIAARLTLLRALSRSL